MGTVLVELTNGHSASRAKLMGTVLVELTNGQC